MWEQSIQLGQRLEAPSNNPRRSCTGRIEPHRRSNSRSRSILARSPSRAREDRHRRSSRTWPLSRTASPSRRFRQHFRCSHC
jgi:hypothetical protein